MGLKCAVKTWFHRGSPRPYSSLRTAILTFQMGNTRYREVERLDGVPLPLSRVQNNNLERKSKDKGAVLSWRPSTRNCHHHCSPRLGLEGDNKVTGVLVGTNPRLWGGPS